MMTFIGTIKNGDAYNVGGKDGSEKIMVSFLVADELGNVYSCQMWSDDPQHGELVPLIKNMRRHRVQFVVAGYTSRMRKFKDGSEKPQTNFIVTQVSFPDVAA